MEGVNGRDRVEEGGGLVMGVEKKGRVEEREVGVGEGVCTIGQGA